ncbi:MAG: septal ring lytic transglycosylase RlpA family protein [Methylomicrobium sp.]|nr:septal ring lytic transglycosylase RlpA family protein [Methylomicrobium sp.]
MSKIMLATCAFVIGTYVGSPVKTAYGEGLYFDEHSTKKIAKRNLIQRIRNKPLSKVSWYGAKFHGKKTASGQKFNMNAMTAAHKTLPLMSYVKVTNPKNDQSVVVQINDRGPYAGHREMDLSYAAAKELGIVKKGVDTVKIEPLTHAQAILELGRDES